jgi:hypothetical protein
MQTFPTEMSPYEVKASQRTDSRSKYYITGQNDLYQTSEFVKFVLLWFRLGTVGVVLWQSAATFPCIVGAVQGLGWPITWLEENVFGGNRERRIRDILGRGQTCRPKGCPPLHSNLHGKSHEYIVPITNCQGRGSH